MMLNICERLGAIHGSNGDDLACVAQGTGSAIKLPTGVWSVAKHWQTHLGMHYRRAWWWYVLCFPIELPIHGSVCGQ